MWHRRFGSSLIRSFVSRTNPLFKKRHGRSKVKTLLKKNHDEDRLSKKIRILKQQLDETESVPKPSKECPRLKSVPFIAKEDLLTDETEISQRLNALQKELIDLRLPKLHPPDRQRLEFDIVMIKNGFPSLWETFGAMRDISSQLENPNQRALVQELMRWWNNSDLVNFSEKFSSIWGEQISEETKAVVLREVERRLKDSGSTVNERIIDAVVDALNPRHKENYLKKVRDTLIRRHVTVSQGKGESMLPTLWSKDCVMLTNPLHPQRDSDVLDSVQIGDIVTFIVLKHNDETNLMTKRLMGLPGDTVAMIDGNSYVVPKGYFWALGDNPDCSTDSRHFGAIPSQNLREQIFFAYPKNNLGFRFFTSRYEFHLK